ncbi:MAG: TIGR04086 family membrane protein [Butyrivibrio sp.]|nr:TIGR04086 family membrane protein [Butyrivibrio sp.]
MKKLISILKVMVLAYIITALLLLLGAFIMYKTGTGDKLTRIITLIVYGVSCITAGLVYTRIYKNRKLLRGALAGIIYYAILIVITIIINRGFPQDFGRVVISLTICTISGIMGALI